MTDLTDTDEDIGRRVTREELEALRRITWRDTELGAFEEEDVKDLGRHTI